VGEAAQDDPHVTDLPLRECPASTPLPSSHPGGPRERRRGNQTRKNAKKRLVSNRRGKRRDEARTMKGMTR
jgi:hypothetical protein